MLDAIAKFFKERLAPSGAAASPDADRTAQSGASADTAPPAVDLAACALLLELAHADEEFSDAERDHLEEVLMRHFDLPEADARQLIALADEERRCAVDLYQFTSLIAASYDEGQKMVLAEVMWRLVYADGELARHEDYLVRKISNLLDLRPGYLAAARARARSDAAD